MFAFFGGLFLLCASTLMYEIVLTRLLSAVCWYYLAFVAVSMAMFGMTAGALAVQLRPARFHPENTPKRTLQAVFAMAVSMPLTLVTMLAVPVDISVAFETVFSFLLFASIIAVPFFFSGIAVCLALTKTPFPIGRVYSADLFGGAVGSMASVLVLKVLDAPSAIIVIAGLLFLSAAGFAAYARDDRYRRRSYVLALGMFCLGALNATTIHGIQPIWAKGILDRRINIATEVWSPISKVRAYKPGIRQPEMWGPSPHMPHTLVDQVYLNIDNDAGTPMTHFEGDLQSISFLRYDVTSLGGQLRAGGSAAIIGVGGGRDVLNCSLNGFRRIIGIEINSAMIDLDMKRFGWFSGLNRIPGFEIHNDEGRSYLTRTPEKFDLIQASLVDTWAATSAGALTLAENSLYTVDAWQIYYRHLKPGGVITFSRWYTGAEAAQTYRLFALAWAMLLSEGNDDPGRNIALLFSQRVATILVSNQPFSQKDLQALRSIADQMDFKILFFPSEGSSIPELQKISSMRTLTELASLRTAGEQDYSPVFDSSPYFFNALRLRNIPAMILQGGRGGNLRAIAFISLFMLAATTLVIVAIVLPVRRWARHHPDARAPKAGIAYFASIGVGFMLVEISMMQQLSIFLGHPVYSLVVVLGGLILSTGVGSLVSDRMRTESRMASLVPAATAALITVAYSTVVVPVIHRYTAALLWQRVVLSLALTAPCGFLMGFCFPVGLRWLRHIREDHNLPWMWPVNGAAGTLGSFVAILISMETTITICTLTGAACYLVASAAMALMPREAAEAHLSQSVAGSIAAASTP